MPLSYEEWKKKYAPHDSGQDYDLVAAWQKGLVPTNGHFPDTFKFPNHPTFSVESRFYQPGLPAGRWEGETFIPMSATGAAQWQQQVQPPPGTLGAPQPPPGYQREIFK